MRDGRERAAVGWAGAVDAEAFEVVGCSVSFVFRESILRKVFVELHHEPVPGDFRNDAGGSNRETDGVAADKCCVWHRQASDWESVHQGMIHVAEVFERFAHGEVGGIQNVEAIDVRGLDSRDRPAAHLAGCELFEKNLPAAGSQFLGIIKSIGGHSIIEPEGSGNNRSCQRTSPGFVDAGHAESSELIFPVK